MKKSKRRQVKEQLILFSLLKPGADAWRSAKATASNREVGIAVSAHAELTIIRAIELCFESVPGTVLQLAALIHAKKVDSVAYLALASSFLTSGSVSAYMSWVLDMNKAKREGVRANLQQ